MTENYSLINGAVVDNETGETVNGLIVRVDNVTTKEGKTFTAYKALLKNTRFIDLAFTMAAAQAGKVPTGLVPGYYIFVVDMAETRIDKNRMYPRLYVKNLRGVLPYDKSFKSTLEI